MTSRPSDALVAAAATVAAVLGLTTLTEGASWLAASVWACLTVAVTGIGLRRLTSRGVLVVLGQVLLVGWTVIAVFAGDRLWWGLPGPSAIARVGELVRDCVDVMQRYAAPVPSTRGVELVLVGAVAALALVVDYLAVTRSSPAAAGLPLLTAFLTAAANSGASLAPGYFLVAATLWLILVSRQGQWSVRRWSTTVASPRTPTSNLDVEGDALGGFGSVARQLGVVALIAAVALPALIPHLPTRYILDGLGRSDDAVGRGGGRVGFNSTLDLTRSLRDGSVNPVLAYRTSSPSTPPPLRVTVTSDYVAGEWRTRPGAQPRAQRLTAVALVAPDVAVKDRTMTVERNLLDAPHVASAQPVVGADFGDTTWGADPSTNDLVVATRPDSYTVTYREVNVTSKQLQAGIPDGASGRDDPAVRSALAVDPASVSVVAPLTEKVTAGASTPYASAIAIQNWLRGNGFTYSLELAPPTTDAKGVPITDPLVHFLTTKQGYCVQFASAMVMMARAKGIPARMAIGFLPGQQENGLWTVRSADAHAWPELYFPGAGWLRFEPTPSVRTGSAPAYTVPLTGSTTGTTGGREAGADGATASATAGPRDNGGVQDATSSTTDALPLTTRVQLWLQDGRHLVLLALALGFLGTFVLPLTASLVNRRRRLMARTRSELAEAQWTQLVSRLGDLGLPPPPGGGTLRQWRRHYSREAYLDDEADASMGHVVATLERARYARPGSEPVELSDDIRRVTRAAAVSRPWRQRLRAFLVPQDGVRWWSRALTRVTGAPGRWIDSAVDRLPRLPRLPRRR